MRSRRVPCADAVFRPRFTDEDARACSDSRGHFASGRDPAPPPLPAQCEDHVGGTSGLADVSSLGEFLGATTLKESTASNPTSSLQAVPDDTIDAPQSGHCLSSSLGSIIWVQKPPHGRPGVYHIRKDRLGSFHTYPDLGGPFQSLNEAEDVISIQFEERAGESYVDMIIRKALYWPDGTRKKCSKAEAFQNVNNNMNQLAKVILDMYNDDHNLLEDHAFELKGVINYEPIIESRRWFDHINFTATTKGLNGLDSDHLFFAEAMSLKGEKDYVVTCCSLISSDDNGNCYTCKIGNKSMKHPSDVNSYVGGHCHIKGIYDTIVSSDSEEDEDAEEQRLRKMFQGLDDPGSAPRRAAPPPAGDAPTAGGDDPILPWPLHQGAARPGEHGGSGTRVRVRMWCSDPSSRMRPYKCAAILVGISPQDAIQPRRRCCRHSVRVMWEVHLVLDLHMHRKNQIPSSSPQAISKDTINSSPSVRCLSSPGSIIWVREPPEDRLGVYHIQMDRSGSFHTYPDLGGPFQSLNEAQDAISSHLNWIYPPVKFQERPGESYVDRMIREKLYWPDGTRKKCSKAQAFENVKNMMNQLAKVILDMYNDDQNFSEDLSYELKEVVSFEPIFESHRWFDHINFTANTKGSKGLDRDHLFFAEAMSLEGQKDYVVTCCSLISSNDNGNCYTCKFGNRSMKHPNDVNSYVGGHCYITGIYDTEVSSDSEEDEDAEEQRLRKMYQVCGKSFLVEVIMGRAQFRPNSHLCWPLRLAPFRFHQALVPATPPSAGNAPAAGRRPAPSPSMASRTAGRERDPCEDEEVRVYSDSRGYFASGGRDVDVGPFPTSDELYAALDHHYHLRSKPCDPAPLPTQCEGLLRGASEPESAQALQEPDVLSVGELLGAIALKEPIISSPSSSPQAVPEDNIDAVPSGCCLSSSPGSVIWVHKPPEGRRGSYHIRMDRSGLFHTYPDMGGPFLSLNEAQDAFTSHLNILYPPLKFEERDGESIVDMMVRKILYFPDGTRRRYSKSQVTQDVHNDMRQLARGLAYELKDVIHFQPIMESCTWFDHLNFTALTKGDNELDYQIHLFFAELMCLVGQKDYIVTCCCALKSDDNGNCYNCKLQNVNLKHPNDTNQYAGGHEYLCGIYDTEEMSESEDEEKEEQRIRKLYEDLEEPGLHEKLFGDVEETVSRNSRGYFALGYSLPGEPFPSLHELLGAIYDHYHPQRESRDPAPPPLLPQCEEHVEGNTQLSLEQTLEEPEVATMEESPEPTTLGDPFTATTSSLPSAPHGTSEVSPSSRLRHHTSPESTIWTRDPADWPWIYHIRMDRGGSFHTYPALDGPFLNLYEAEDAINRHLESLKCPMFKEQDGVSPVERMIQKSLYWPDGTRKKYSRSQASQNVDKRRRQMVQVLLDKYNDDHDLVEDLAYELQDVVHYQLIVEGIKWFNHFNFTAKTSGADIDNLFFAEVMSSQGEEDWVVTCCCLIKSADNGICYGCKNDRNLDMKHPNDSDTYVGGHKDIVMPFETENWTESESDDDEDEEEEVKASRIRRMIEGLDDSDEPEDIFDPVFKP
uniref:DUF3615 domain-containing protein n=1 Tax=Oryza meridionalis TaxID=40149 RepID=A0A0E0DWA6_9ORYZ